MDRVLQTFYRIIALVGLLGIPKGYAAETKPEVWITVFVHGIMSVKPHLTPSNFIRFIRDDIDEKAIYFNTVSKMRNDPYFYYNQAMQGLGLQKIDLTQINKGAASAILANAFQTVDSFVNAENNVENHYYTFGWSGLISPRYRLQDAQKLYESLSQEVAVFHQKGVHPKIRVIGYSHGGNVCLYLASAHYLVPTTTPLSIDEAVLLGMPVQKETDYLINDPIFKRIYHIYSRRDRIQKLDFFSTNRFFSRRIFKARKGFTLPDKLLQIQLKCTRENSARIKSSQRIKAVYNMHSHATVSGKSRYLRDAAPGHTELWFFGWTPLHYRKNFPLYPLPAAALIPAIVKIAQDFDGKQKIGRPTLIDIRPEHELVLVADQRSHQVLTIMKFLPKTQLDELRAMVLKYAPDSYPEKIYLQHIKDAHQQASQEYSQKKKKRRSHEILT